MFLKCRGYCGPIVTFLFLCAFFVLFCFVLFCFKEVVCKGWLFEYEICDFEYVCVRLITDKIILTCVFEEKTGNKSDTVCIIYGISEWGEYNETRLDISSYVQIFCVFF